MSHSTQSRRVCDSTQTRSPGTMPAGPGPAAISRAAASACLQVRSSPAAVLCLNAERGPGSRPPAASTSRPRSRARPCAARRCQPHWGQPTGMAVEGGGHGVSMPGHAHSIKFRPMSAKSLPRWRLVGARRRDRRAVGQARDALLAGLDLRCGCRRSGKARRQAWFGQVVLDLFRQLGATFIKVGQIMSTRPDLIPDYVSSALAAVARRRRPVPVRGTSCAPSRPTWAARSRALFAEFAPVPIASASVVAGPQGPPARRPHRRGQGAPARRRRDLHVRPGRDAPVGARDRAHPVDRDAVADRDAGGVRPRDLRAARFPHRGEQQPPFPRQLQGPPRRRVPRGRRATCRRARPDHELHRRGRRSSRRARPARSETGRAPRPGSAAEDDLRGRLRARRPAPGNIFITPDDKLALLDLGLVGELDEPHRNGFSRLFAAWAQRDGDGWRASFTASRLVRRTPGDPERFDACVSAAPDPIRYCRRPPGSSSTAPAGPPLPTRSGSAAISRPIVEPLIPGRSAASTAITPAGGKSGNARTPPPPPRPAHHPPDAP